MSEIPPIKTLVAMEHVNISGTTQNSAQSPNALSGVANGTLVEGFVVKRDTNNQPILRTQIGDVLLSTNIFLKTGTEVTIRVDHSQPNLARIITINGQTPEAFSESQKAQLTRPQGDSLSSQLAAAIQDPSKTAIPKPVLLQGVMLQLAPRETIPAQMADALFKTLGIDKPIRMNAPAPSPTLSVLLRSITMPPAPEEGSAPALQTPSSASQTTQPPQLRPAMQPASPLPSVPLPAVSNPLPQAPTIPAPALPQTPPAVQILPASISPQLAAQSMQALPQQVAAPSNGNVTAPVPSAMPSGIAPLPQATAPMAQGGQTSSIPAAHTPPATNGPVPLPPMPAPPATVRSPMPASPMPVTGQIPTAATQPPATPTAPLAAIEITPQKTVNLQGLVIGQEQQTDTILHTPIGSMRIFTPKPLPAGATVALEISIPKTTAPLPSPQTPLATTGLQTDSTEELLRDWPGLAELAEEILQDDSALFQTALARAIPTPGKHFTQSMLFFLSALKGGDLKQWLGTRNTEQLESKYGDIIRKLGADFTSLQQIFNEPTQQNWVSTTIPILYQNILHQARLHIRQDAEPANKPSQNGQRFIIDVELSRLGEMQIDGLVQKDNSRHQFDMIIRTSKALPSDVEQDIRTIYTNAAEIAGFKGNLLFHASREHFVRVETKQDPKGAGGIIA